MKPGAAPSPAPSSSPPFSSPKITTPNNLTIQKNSPGNPEKLSSYKSLPKPNTPSSSSRPMKSIASTSSAQPSMPCPNHSALSPKSQTKLSSMGTNFPQIPHAPSKPSSKEIQKMPLSPLHQSSRKSPEIALWSKQTTLTLAMDSTSTSAITTQSISPLSKNLDLAPSTVDHLNQSNHS